jgi:glycine oxidase
MISIVPLGRASLQLYPEFVATVEEISGQSAGYRARGTLEALFSTDAQEKLSTIIALHHGLGLRAEPVRAEDAREMEPALSPELEAAVFRSDEACVDNRALTKAVLTASERSGVKTFAGSSVQSIAKTGRRCDGFVVNGEKVQSRWTVIAAGCCCAEIEGAAQYAPVRPAKGQMIALRAKDLRIERVLWSDHVYLVPRNDGRILAGATVEYVGFEKKVTAGGVHKIISAALQLAPALADAQIEETWAGLRPDAPDHLPIIGPTDLDGLLIATGHFRSGILLAPITAQLIREWVTTQNVRLDWARFSPMRFGEVARATNS